MIQSTSKHFSFDHGRKEDLGFQNIYFDQKETATHSTNPWTGGFKVHCPSTKVSFGSYSNVYDALRNEFAEAALNRVSFGLYFIKQCKFLR